MASMPNALPAAGSEVSTRSAAWRAAIGAILLGAALVFVAGFAQMDAIHNGAHDARHDAALPCH